MTDEQQRDIENFWKVELEKISRGLRKVAEGSTLEKIKQVYTRNRKLLEDKLANSKGGLQ